MRVYQIVESGARDDRASVAFDWFIISLILLNVGALTLETVREFREAAPGLFLWFERASVAIFAIEYVLRLWSCSADERYRGFLRGRIRFALTPMALIDLIAILPSLLPFVGIDLRSLRILRVFRLLRILKLARYSLAMRVFGRVVRDRAPELITTLSFLFVLLFLSATILYYCENAAQPDVFSSIPESMWWAVATLTTVGYGDAYPITVLGRLFGGIIAILGIGMVALPTGILSAAFAEELANERRERAATTETQHSA